MLLGETRDHVFCQLAVRLPRTRRSFVPTKERATYFFVAYFSRSRTTDCFQPS
jgi:hypothetical protein